MGSPSINSSRQESPSFVRPLNRLPVLNSIPASRSRWSQARRSDGGFLTSRKNALARADVCLDRQLLRPRPQRIRAKLSEQIAPPLRFRAVTSWKVLHRLAVRQVQSAASCDEKLSPRRRLCVAKHDARTAGRGHFRRAQTGRTRADNYDDSLLDRRHLRERRLIRKRGPEQISLGNCIARRER